MKPRNLASITSLILTSLSLVSIASQAASKSEPAMSAQAAFEKLKGLAGEWQGTEGEKSKGQGMPIVYKLTSHGTVLMEIMGPGTQEEMITMYHIDGNKLLLTHYCGLGNQPVMALTSKSTEEALDFDYSGATNMKSKKDMHMHALRIRFEGKDAIATEWDLYQDGKKTGTTKFFLSRKV
jgi:hypothetical protein